MLVSLVGWLNHCPLPAFVALTGLTLLASRLFLAHYSFLIVIFGEIVPQAACQRYSLEVGSTMAPVMRVVMYLLFPVAYPLSKGLDFALGEELATTYSSSEMIKLLQIHVNEQIIDSDTATAMKGALKYKDMTVKEVMTPLANVFMLSAEERLNFETIAKIFKTGYSRIPVYHVSKVRTTRRMAFVLVSGLPLLECCFRYLSRGWSSFFVHLCNRTMSLACCL